MTIDEDTQQFLRDLPDSLILYWQVRADGTVQPVVQTWPAEWMDA